MRRVPALRAAGHPLRYARNLVTYLLRPRGREPRRPATVVFDLARNPYQRYLFLLAEFFALSGYEVVFRHRARFVGQLGRYADLILATPHMRLCFSLPAEAELRFTDRPRDGWITLSADYFSLGVPAAFRVPMAMHPNMYRHGYFRRCRELGANAERGIRVLFAGNAEPSLYSGGAVPTVFGKLGRLEILESLAAAFHSRIARNLPDDKDSSAGGAAIVLCEASSCYIPQTALLETLSRCAFFLAAPGVAMPMCHNAVESMSVGAIPILNYPEHFHPPLEHGVNCLTFATADDLSRCVREALAMDETAIAALRLGALAYYDRHLDPEAVVDSIVRERDVLRTVFLNGEQRSVELLRSRSERGVPG